MTMASQALWIKFNSFTELQGSFDLILSLTAWPLPIQAMSNHIQFPQFPECTALSLRTTLPSSSGQLLSSFMSQLTCPHLPDWERCLCYLSSALYFPECNTYHTWLNFVLLSQIKSLWGQWLCLSCSLQHPHWIAKWWVGGRYVQINMYWIEINSLGSFIYIFLFASFTPWVTVANTT